MKRTISFLLCALLLLQIPFAMTASAAKETTVLFEDAFNYDGFAGLYDSTKTWRNECKTGTDGVEYGATNVDLNAPAVQNNVIKFVKGDSLRFNWTQLADFATFDAAKTYTLTFDVKVTDFGDNTTLANTSNRELYFAPGGYYNQIEMRNANHSNLGFRAGDTWNNDLTVYTLNTVYSCTVVWDPTNSKITTTIKNGDTVVATGNRTNTGYGALNKYTKFFVWRCEDGAIEMSNLTFSDGTTTYVAPLSGTPMNGAGIWGSEPRLTDAISDPNLGTQKVIMPEKSGFAFHWPNVSGMSLDNYNSTNTYIFEFDAKITDKGDGTIVNSVSSMTRSLYVAFGGWYDVVALPTSADKVTIGGTSVDWDDALFLNQDLHIKVEWTGANISASITDTDGNVLISGARTPNTIFADPSATAYMTNLGLRCEDGAAEVDNFKFSVVTNEPVSTHDLTIGENQQVVYQCDVNYKAGDTVAGMLGAVKAFALEESKLYIGGKQIVGSYGEGTYQFKLWVNPTQEMVTVQSVDPDGNVARRGCYTLVGGENISVYTENDSTVTNETLVYDTITVNDYTLLAEEPTYEGFAANVYNLVTSFEVATSDRAFAWTALADFIGTDAMALQYRVSGTEEWMTADAVKETDSVETEEYFKCDINELAADTTYEYRIGRKDSTDEANDWSQVYTFKTAAYEVGDFTFLAVGDTQGITWGGEVASEKGFKYAQAAIAQAVEENPNAAFLLHTGDAVEYGHYTNQWNMYFKALGENSASLPHFAALGNHDALGGGVNFDLHFNHPNNGGTAALDPEIIANIANENLKAVVQNADETIYSYNYGDAHFIVLNTGAYVHSDDRYVLEAQRQWLIDDLEANKDARWKIMLIHQAVHHRNGGNYDRQQLEDVIENYGVDLVLQGHSHLVTRTYPMKNSQIATKQNPDVVQQGVGTVYTTIGSTALNHDGANDTINDEEMYHIVTPTATQPAYTSVEVKGDALHVVIKQVNGLIIDEFTINATAAATNDGKNYDTLEEALTEAEAGDTVVLQKDVLDSRTVIDPGVTLDLNGKALHTDMMVAFGSSAVVNSADNACGKIVVDKDDLVLPKTNPQLPVYDGENGCFLFSRVKNDRNTVTAQTDGLPKYSASPMFKDHVHDLMNTAAKAENSGVDIIIRLRWVDAQGQYEGTQDYIYYDTQIAAVISSYVSENGSVNYAQQFYGIFTGSEIESGVNVTVSTIVKSSTGVEMESAQTALFTAE